MAVSINPLGAEILVNTATSSDQTDARVALLANGGFVVTWTDASQTAGDSDGLAVKAQLFDASSQPVGSEFLVNSTTPGDQASAKVTALANGGFVVTWTSTSFLDSQVMAQVFAASGAFVGDEINLSASDPSSSGQQAAPEIVALRDGGFVVTLQATPSAVGGDGDGWGIAAQRFNDSGQAMGGPRTLASNTFGDQTDPQIAALSNGGYVVIWQDGAIHAQTYAADGTTTNGEILVNASTLSAPVNAKVAALDSGWFVVVWDDNSGDSSDNSGSAVKARLFNASSAVGGPEILVNTAISGDQIASQVVRLSDGGFVIVWQDHSQGDGGASGDTSGWAIKGQVFDSSGAKIGGEILVNTVVDGDQTDPQVTTLDNGGFAVAWQDASQTGGDMSGLAIRAQAFDSAGNAIGGEQQVNSTALGDQSDPHIAALTDGGFTVTWTDNSANGADSSGVSIRMQAFGLVADSHVWTGAGSDLWSDGRNWSDRIAPGSTDAITLTGAAFQGARIVIDTVLSGLYANFAGRALTLSARLDITGTSDRAFNWLAGSLVLVNGAELALHARTEIGDYSTQTPRAALVVDAGAGGLATLNLSGGAWVLNYGDINIISGTLKLESGSLSSQTTSNAKITVGSSAAASGATLEIDGGLSSPLYLERGATIRMDAKGLLSGNVFVEGDATLDVSGSGSAGLVDSIIFSKLGETIDLRLGLNQYASIDGSKLSFVTNFSTYSTGSALNIRAGWAGGQSLPSNVLVRVRDDGAGGKLVSLAERNPEAPVARIGGETTDLSVVGDGIGDSSGQVVALSNGGFVVVDEIPPTITVAGIPIDVRAAVFNSAGVKIGNDFLVSDSGGYQQFQPTVTALVGGGFAVSWWDEPYAYTTTSVYKVAVFNVTVQNAYISKVSEASIVSPTYPYGKSQQKVTALAHGAFVVTWVDRWSNRTYYPDDPPSDFGYFIHAQLFDPSGLKVGSVLTVNAVGTSDTPNQIVAPLGDVNGGGGFVVIWRDVTGSAGATGDSSGFGLHGQVIDRLGAKVGDEFLVNTATAGNQDLALVAELGGGHATQSGGAQLNAAFVVVWTDASAGIGGATGDASGLAIKAQVFLENGAKSGDEILVNTTTAGDQRLPVVTALDSGGFVVVWEDDGSYSLKAQIFSHSGYIIGGEILVNTATVTGYAPQVTALPNGGFVVTYTGGGAPGDQTGAGVKAQAFSASGQKIGHEILVNTTTTGGQEAPRIATLANGDFVITWINGNSNSNGYFREVRSQVFSLNWVDETWVASGAGDWSTPANWARGVTPANADDVTIHAGEADLSANAIVESLTLDGASAKVRLSGQLGVTHAATITDGTVELADGGVLRAADGLILAAPLTGSAGGTLVADAPAAVATVYAQIRNDDAITASAGTLILHGDITGTGVIQDLGGAQLPVLEIDGATAQKIVLSDGATLQLDQAARVTSQIELRGNAILDLRGAPGFGGEILFANVGQTLDLLNDTATSASLNGGTLSLAGSGAFGEGGETVKLRVGLQSAPGVPLSSDYRFVIRNASADITLITLTSAVTYTWTGAAGDGNWGSAGNWTPAGVPGVGATFGADVVVATAGDTVYNNWTAQSVAHLTVTGIAGKQAGIEDHGGLAVTDALALDNAFYHSHGFATIGAASTPDSAPTLSLIDGSVLSVDSVGGVYQSTLRVNGQLVANSSSIVVTKAVFSGRTAIDTATTWKLGADAIVAFYGLVAGGGDTFTFDTADTDRASIIFGNQGSAFTGAITGFGLYDKIDLSKLAYDSTETITGTSGGQWTIQNATGALFTFSDIALTNANAALVTSSDGNGGTNVTVLPTCTWTGAAGDGKWGSAGNWTPAGVPGVGATLGADVVVAGATVYADGPVYANRVAHLTVTDASIYGLIFSVTDVLALYHAFYQCYGFSSIGAAATSDSTPTLTLNDGSVLSVYSGGGVYQSTLRVNGQLVSNSSKIDVTDSAFFGQTAIDTATTWKLGARGHVWFSGLVAGSGDTFAFSDDATDSLAALSFGNQGSAFSGAITGFGLSDFIDLTQLAYDSTETITGTSGGQWTIQNATGTLFTFSDIALAYTNATLVTSSDGNGGTKVSLWPTYTWTGAAGDRNWGSAGNWTPAGVPGVGATLGADVVVAGATVFNGIGGAQSIAHLTVTGAAGNRADIEDRVGLTVTDVLALDHAFYGAYRSATIGAAATSESTPTLTLIDGSVLSVDGTSAGFFTPMLIVKGQLVANSSTIDVKYGEFAGHSASDTATTWKLGDDGWVWFSDLVAGSGDTFAFDTADSYLARVIFGNQGSAFTGAITGFGLYDKIDLSQLAYDPTETITGASGGQWTIQNATGALFTFSDIALADANATLVTSSDDNGGTEVITICFVAGTMIRTPRGEVAIETLRRGDMVLTSDGKARPLDWLGRQTVSSRFADPIRSWPIRVKAGAIGDNVPCRDLLVSPDHALLVEGVLMHAGALVNGTSIVRETTVPEIFVYYHIELADHSLILVENTPAETFIDNVDRMHFDNWDEHEALYPDGKPIVEMPHPRAKARRQVPMRIRAALDERANILGEGKVLAVA